MKRILAVSIGQSNEVGNGVTVDRVAAYGFPLNDPIGPNGYARSMWPRLSELLGEAGVMMNFRNTARGSTSLVRHWLGYVTNWVASPPNVYTGQLVLSDGGIWKANLAAGAYVASVTAPTGTSNVTLDTIPWVYLGTPQPYEVAGYICKPGDARFDPNGYVAAALASALLTGTYEERWAFVGFGQQDALHQSTRDEFKRALIILTDYFLASGIRVLLGMSCYSMGTNYEARYQANLLPGLADALDYYAGNPNVCAGANLRNALGILPQEPAPSTHYMYPALQNYGNHMNDAAYIQASGAQFDAVVAAGWHL